MSNCQQRQPDLRQYCQRPISEEDYITALTGDGIEELQDMLTNARDSINEWHSFIDVFVDNLDIIARVKKQPLR